MHEFMNVSKALADESRVRLLLALSGRELCVCQLTELLGSAPSTVSKHLSVLFQAGLVESRKEGRWIYYRWPGPKVSRAIRLAIDWVAISVANNPRILKDAELLAKILKIDAAELCKRQCQK